MCEECGEGRITEIQFSQRLEEAGSPVLIYQQPEPQENKRPSEPPQYKPLPLPDYTTIKFKKWVTQGGSCLICKANEDFGSIPMDWLFPDGSYDPPAHKNCRCGLEPADEADHLDYPEPTGATKGEPLDNTHVRVTHGFRLIHTQEE